MRAWIAVIVVVWVSALALAGPDDQPPPALVCLVEGSVDLTQSLASESRPLKLLDRLLPGDVLQLSGEGRVVVVLVDGRRFEIVGPGRAELAREGVRCRKGRVRELERVATTPNLAPILASESVGEDTAASRVRGDEEEADDPFAFWPPTGALVLASSVKLGVEPGDAVVEYRLQIKNHDHETVYEAADKRPEFSVPPGVLEAGLSFRWFIAPASTGPPEHAPWPVFETLEGDGEEARLSLAAAAAAGNTPDLYVLLAELDSRLGLWSEPCDDLGTAIRLGGPEPAIHEIMAAQGCPGRD